MLEELYKKLYTELLRWCCNMCGNIHLAEDLVNEAFVKALAKEDLLSDFSEQQKRAWMYRTVRNQFIDYCRKQNREQLYDFLSDSPSEDDDLAGSPLSAGDEEVIWSMLLSKLPEEERKLFVMRYLMGYTSRELGEIFNLPPGTVRSRLHSARRRLRKEIDR